MPDIGNGITQRFTSDVFRQRESRLDARKSKLMTVMVYTVPSPTVLVPFTYIMDVSGRDIIDTAWELAIDRLDNGDNTSLFMRDVTLATFECTPQQALELTQLCRNYVAACHAAANDLVEAGDNTIDLDDDQYWPPYDPYDGVGPIQGVSANSASDPKPSNYMRRNRRRWRRLGMWVDR